MNGLNEIISINNHAAELALEKNRRARGLKPASVVGQALRAASTRGCSPFRAGARTVVAGGRTVTV